MSKAWKKSLTWNALAFTITTIVSYLMTGSIEIAGSIGLIERVIKLIVYHYHEKLWK